MLVVSLPRFRPGLLLGLVVALVVLGVVALAFAYALGVNGPTVTHTVAQAQDIPFRW